MDPKGISNLGNTCFLNSVLQALHSVPCFSEGLAGLQRNRKKCTSSRTGQMCLLCSTLNFLNLYGTAPGTVRPATLVSCLPQISSQIQTGQQQCAAEFFQEFCRVLGHTANQYQSQHLIPTSCNLAFLRSFFFELRSEVMCSSCNSITSTTTMETILPLHITKMLKRYGCMEEAAHMPSAQPSGHRPKLSNSNKDTNMKVRKTFNNHKRRRNLAHNIRKNVPNAGPKR